MALKLGELGYTSRPEAVPQASTPQVPNVDLLGGKLAVIQAAGNVADTTLLAAKKISDERATYQAQEATLKYENEMQKWTVANRKEYYSADELPDDIKVRRTDKVVGADGEIQEAPRTDIPAYEVYPQLFEKQMRSSIDASSFGIDRADVRKRWSEVQTVEGQRHLVTVTQASVTAQQGAIRKATLESIDEAAKAGNRQAVVALTDQYPGTRQEKEAILRKGLHNVELNDIQNSIATGDLQAMEAHIARLNNPKEPSNLTGPEREAAVRELQQRSLQNVASKAFADQLKRDNVWLQLGAQARAGTMNEMDGRRAREAGIITTPQLLELLDKNASAVAKNTSQKLSFAELARLQGERPGHSVVVGNTDNQKAVDDAYVIMTAGASAEEKFSHAAASAATFDYLPQPFRAELQAADRSTNPDVLFAAATQFREIQRQSPNSLRDMKDEDTQNIRRVLAVLELGGPNAEISAKDYAARLTRMTPADKEQERQRGETVQKYVETTSPNDIVDYFQKRGDINRWYQFSGVAKPSVETIAELKKAGKVPLETHTALPASAQAEFEVMFRQELVNAGGDAAVAKQSALARFAATWRPTEVNGFGQFMRDMPRGVSDKVLREYIDLAHPGSEGDIFIMSDKSTQLAVSARAPTIPYQLYRIDPDTKAPMFVGQMNYEPTTFAANLAEMRKNTAVTKKELSVVEEAKFVSENTAGSQSRAMIEVARRTRSLAELPK